VECEIDEYFDDDDLRLLVGLCRMASANALAQQRTDDVAASKLRRLLARVAHDILDPLQGVINQLDIAEAEVSGALGLALVGGTNVPGRLNAAIETLRTTAQAARRRLRRGVPALSSTLTEARSAVELVASVVRPLAERRGISLNVDLSALAYARVVVDREEFLIAFRNLLMNAVKYSYDGTPEQTRSVNVVGALYLTIENFGIGVLAEEVITIRSEFRRGQLAQRAGREGSGLGLSQAIHVVEAAGGELRLESSYKGASGRYPEGPFLTRVVVRLPVAVSRAP
jgi:two-component system sensor histidine kinase TorS